MARMQQYDQERFHHLNVELLKVRRRNTASRPARPCCLQGMHALRAVRKVHRSARDPPQHASQLVSRSRRLALPARAGSHPPLACPDASCATPSVLPAPGPPQVEERARELQRARDALLVQLHDLRFQVGRAGGVGGCVCSGGGGGS